MSKLLSICVPTYQRPKQLKHLNDAFLDSVMSQYSNDVEIVVCDNSSASIAAENRANLNARVNYYCNEGNIGFAGNFLRCINEATGEFVWIISDDDDVLSEGFEALLRTLRRERDGAVNCIMLPFESITPFGDLVVANTEKSWNVGNSPTMRQLVETNTCPFILFSSAAVRLRKEALEGVGEKYKGNAYMQIVAFLSMATISGRVAFTEVSAIRYNPGYLGWSISVGEMADSLSEVRRFLLSEFNAETDPVRDYEGWLLWLLHHRGGAYFLHRGDEDRARFLRQFPACPSLKSALLLLALYAPRRVLRPAYLLYKSYVDSRVYGRRAPREILNRLSTNYVFMKDLRRAYEEETVRRSLRTT